MLMRFFCAVLLMGALAVASANVRPITNVLPLDDKKVVTKVDDKLLETVLDELNIDFDKDDTEMSSFSWSMDDHDYQLFQYTADDADEDADATELMLQVMIESDEYDESWCNDWNAASRFGRTYYSEGSLYIEFDLDVAGGVTVGAIKQFITKFTKTVEAVESFDDEGEGGF
jgi:hypothetical protein